MSIEIKNLLTQTRLIRVVNGPKILSPTRPDPNSIIQARNQILIYQPVEARFIPEIKNIVLIFEEILVKKKEFYPSTITPVTNNNICTRCSLCFIPAIAKNPTTH